MALKNLKTSHFSPGDSKGLDIESLISAPLVAASVANSMMAKEQARFIMDFCFTKDGENYHPVMINMSITNTVTEPAERENGRLVKPQSTSRVTTTFQLPLLTIIPINSLAVESVSVQFEMELMSQQEDASGYPHRSELLGGSNAPPDKKAKLMGKVSYDSTERASTDGKQRNTSQNSSSLKVNVNAGQLPLPVGMSTILNLYTKTIHPVQTPEQNNENTDQGAPPT